ncbi:MAG TPA: type I phosphomannose isomerase catalytic subunit [Bacteroidales bacterium]|nr:type I phosphomannose isomerase catalytic subunit [Bacteroidales bacterium]
MAELYPLKFETVLKEKVWGGRTLVNRYNKQTTLQGNIGESWEISAVSDNLSIVSNGFLAGNNIEELIEVYMGDITGDSVYEKFGSEFPLLIKFIEARQDLSIQVHPGNDLAKKRHNAYGKTEMWYILESEKDAKIYTGFREGTTKEAYLKAVDNGTIVGLMNVETPQPGDTFFTPAGKVHAIGAGTVLVEIQQTSDITYRIFDWNRKGSGKEKRELHTDLATDAIDFTATGKSAIKTEAVVNKTSNLVDCEFFNTNFLRFNQAMRREYYLLDSFVIYICTEGEFIIRWEDNHDHVKKGETILLPAEIKEVILEPVNEAQILEVFINEETKYI